MKAIAFSIVVMFIATGCTKTDPAASTSSAAQEKAPVANQALTPAPAPLTKEEIQQAGQKPVEQGQDRKHFRTAVPAPLTREEIERAGKK